MDDYLEALKKGKTRNFWPKLFKDYLEKFHWRLPLHQEPSPDDAFPSDSNLTVQELDEKTKVVTELKRKIKSWYNHRRTAMGLTANPFTPWLSRLRRPTDKAPGRLPDYQFYMQHDDFKNAAEPEEVKARIRKEAQEEQDEVLKSWNDADEGLPSLEPEEQEEWVAPAASEPKKRKRAAGKKKPRKRAGRNARGRDADEDSAEETESNDNDGADGSDGEEG
ncbi:hypothetical protein B0H13DRAFT_2385139 [Mycena leptocephala]|nr:hypothetical protein B0H13DRAFT_2385139 [Mycena leptocephala]